MSLQGADYKVFDQLTGDPMDISPWIQSANEKNRALTTLTGEDLIPIYEVIADPIKKQQIKRSGNSPYQKAPTVLTTNGSHLSGK